MKNILVTGGAGYIGSHMVYRLLESEFEPIVLDSFRYSTMQNLDYIQKHFNRGLTIIKQDLREDLSELELPQIDGIIHFAALKAVGKSVEKPLECYENNVYGSINLLKWARDNKVKNFIFSSTAAVYGNNESNPITEDFPLKPASPYAMSKSITEKIIQDCNKAFDLNAVILRYFNVAGCIENGEMGDTQLNVQNLIPSIMLSHLGIRPTQLKVFGNDYPTRDGTGVRDYIHVMDLVEGHLKALENLKKNEGVQIFNLGSGNGYSVMEVIKTFEKVSGEKLSYEVVERRPGDVVEQYCDSTKAKKEMDWQAQRDLEQMIESMWRWYKESFKKTDN